MSDKTAFYCTKCGTELVNGACPKCSQVQQADNAEKFKRFFMNPNEQFVCALGNGYIQDFLANGSVEKGFAVVSDKRVYFKGKTYDVVGKKLRATNEARTVDLKDITGTGVRAVKYPLLLVLGIIVPILLFLLILIITTSLVMGEPNYGAIIPTSLIIAAVFGCPLLICYFATRKTILTISYAGGCIAFEIKWYSQQESADFQRNLRVAKDNAVENAENAAANAVREVISSVSVPTVQTVQAVQPQAPVISADELTKYAQLYKDGLISEQEFAAIKAKLFSGNT